MGRKQEKELVPKKISILGSTGSIGRSTLEVVRKNRGAFRVIALAAGSNVALLKEQISEFEPELVSVKDEDCADELRSGLGSYDAVRITFGQEGLIQVATPMEVELVVSALVGAAGLVPTLMAVRKGKDVALANKETLVMAGKMIMKEAGEKRVRIIPIDSEHSAIFQSLQGHNRDEVRRIILTASGGPFLPYSYEQLQRVTPEAALAHPNWKMGKKVTIDSASLMNKGLEVIEAHWLFGIPSDRIDVMIHPQSIVHSMVEYVDGSVVAQLGIPDMRIPVAYALSYPNRLGCDLPSLDLCKVGPMTFEAPDKERFPALDLAYKAIEEGESMPTVLNAANEIAVQAFLDGRIIFTDIAQIALKTMEEHRTLELSTLDTILSVDRWAREKSTYLINKGVGECQ